MQASEIKSNIEKAQKGLTNKYLTDDQKAKLKDKISQLENQLAKAEADEVEEAERKKNTPPALPAKKRIKKENQSECIAIIADIRDILEKYSDKDPKSAAKKAAASKPVKKKKTSTILVDGVANTVSRAIRRYMSSEKVNTIKVDKLKEAKKHFADGFKSFKQAITSISDPNLVDRFEKQMNEIIEEVEKKQNKTE